MTVRDACARWLLPHREPTPWAALLDKARRQSAMIARLDAWQASQASPPRRYLVPPITVRGKPWHLPDGED